MATYYATYFGLILAQVLGASRQPRAMGLLYWTLLAALFLFSGYRYEVGCDWFGYVHHWALQLPQGFDTAIDSREPGHWALIEILQRAGLPYYSLNVATSAIFFAGLHVVARRQPNPVAVLVLAFPILIVNMPMSGIRQAAAIGLVCFAYMAFLDRKLIYFLAWVGAASLFHTSALLFLLLTPFVNGGYTRRNLMLSSLLALPGAVLLLASGPAELASQRYIATGVEAAGSAFRLGLLTLTGLAYFAFVQRRWYRRFPQDYKLASLGALMMVVFFGLFFISTVIGDRFGYYLIPLQLMIFARLPYLFDGSDRPLFAIAPYALLTVVFVVWTQNSFHFQQCYLPYQSVLF